MKKIIPVFLVILLCAVNYCQAEKIDLPDYKVLAEQCKEKGAAKNCCIASVRAMEKGKYLLDTGKTLKDTTCPSGYFSNTMLCQGSYRWCMPNTTEQVNK